MEPWVDDVRAVEDDYERHEMLQRMHRGRPITPSASDVRLTQSTGSVRTAKEKKAVPELDTENLRKRPHPPSSTPTSSASPRPVTPRTKEAMVAAKMRAKVDNHMKLKMQRARSFSENLGKILKGQKVPVQDSFRRYSGARKEDTKIVQDEDEADFADYAMRRSTPRDPHRYADGHKRSLKLNSDADSAYWSREQFNKHRQNKAVNRERQRQFAEKVRRTGSSNIPTDTILQKCARDQVIENVEKFRHLESTKDFTRDRPHYLVSVYHVRTQEEIDRARRREAAAKKKQAKKERAEKRKQAARQRVRIRVDGGRKSTDHVPGLDDESSLSSGEEGDEHSTSFEKRDMDYSALSKGKKHAKIKLNKEDAKDSERFVLIMSAAFFIKPTISKEATKRRAEEQVRKWEERIESEINSGVPARVEKYRGFIVEMVDCTNKTWIDDYISDLDKSAERSTSPLNTSGGSGKKTAVSRFKSTLQRSDSTADMVNVSGYDELLEVSREHRRTSKLTPVPPKQAKRRHTVGGGQGPITRSVSMSSLPDSRRKLPPITSH